MIQKITKSDDTHLVWRDAEVQKQHLTNGLHVYGVIYFPVNVVTIMLVWLLYFKMGAINGSKAMQLDMRFLEFDKPILRLTSGFDSFISCGPRKVVTAYKTIIDIAKIDACETLKPFAVFHY